MEKNCRSFKAPRLALKRSESGVLKLLFIVYFKAQKYFLSQKNKKSIE